MTQKGSHLEDASAGWATMAEQTVPGPGGGLSCHQFVSQLSALMSVKKKKARELVYSN